MKHDDPSNQSRFPLDPEAELVRRLRQALHPPEPSVGFAERTARQAVAQPPAPASPFSRLWNAPRWRVACAGVCLILLVAGVGVREYHLRQLSQRRRQALSEANYALHFTRRQIRNILLEAVPRIHVNSQL